MQTSQQMKQTKGNRWHLQGKKALVTGGNRNRQKAIVEELLTLGAEVWLVARNEQEVSELVTTLRDQGLPAQGTMADVSKSADCHKLMEQLSQQWDKLDILVNNAGTNIRKKTLSIRRRK